MMALSDRIKNIPPIAQALDAIKMHVKAKKKDLQICIKLRFNMPLRDRTWKWEFYLGDLANDQTRASLLALCRGEGGRNRISFEPMRAMQQPDSEKKLWTWLKKQKRPQ